MRLAAELRASIYAYILKLNQNMYVPSVCIKQGFSFAKVSFLFYLLLLTLRRCVIQYLWEIPNEDMVYRMIYDQSVTVLKRFYSSAGVFVCCVLDASLLCSSLSLSLSLPLVFCISLIPSKFSRAGVARDMIFRISLYLLIKSNEIRSIFR